MKLDTTEAVLEALRGSLFSKDGIPGPHTYTLALRLALAMRVLAIVERRAAVDKHYTDRGCDARNILAEAAKGDGQ